MLIYFIYITEKYIVKYYRLCLWLDWWCIFIVVRFQSSNWNVKKSQYLWNKYIIPWKLLERFLFSRCNIAMHQKCLWMRKKNTSLVHCTHSFVFLMHRNSWMKSEVHNFHGIISISIREFPRRLGFPIQRW